MNHSWGAKTCSDEFVIYGSLLALHRRLKLIRESEKGIKKESEKERERGRDRERER